ncbi:MAG: HD domain-containing protein [Fibrobacteria bacterium]|nr:HD domain-containing protein [Fibrobacteria bacterium]
MDPKLKKLLNASYEIGKEKELNGILLKLTDVTRSILDADRCSIFLHDKEHKELWTIVAHGVKEIRIPESAGIAGHVATTGESLNIKDAYKDSRFDKDVDKKTGYTTSTMLTFPLRNIDEESIGVFQVINKKNGKPFDNEDIDLLQHLSLYVASNIENTMLHEKVKKAGEDAIYRLSYATKFKDPETQSHIIRVGLYGEKMADALKWSAEEQEIVKLATPMHDIGKVGIPDRVLQKPGKLDDEEWGIMKKHSLYGYEILKGGGTTLMQKAAITALDHHEKWNGTGYPNGKKEKEISSYGRFAAISDVFDALTSSRCYKKAWPYEKAFELLREERGQHFDPKFVDVFLENADAMKKIREDYKD